MPGICQQGEAVGQQAADDLHEHEAADEGESPPERLLVFVLVCVAVCQWSALQRWSAQYS